MANVLFEIDNFIPDCINRAGVADVDIDGGTAITVGAESATDPEVYSVSKAVAESPRVAIAYNPSVKYDVIGGKMFPAQSKDDRDYTNPKGRVLDFFFPRVGIQFGILGAGITGTLPTVGKFLEPTATGWATKTQATSGVASFKVVRIDEAVKYPTFNFTDGTEKVYVLETVYNG